MTARDPLAGDDPAMKKLTTLALVLALGGIFAACNTPAASIVPSAISSAAASPLASAAAAVTDALDELDAAIAANSGGEGLSAEDQATLEGLAGDLRSEVESGDLTAAASTLGELATTVEGLQDELTAEAAPQLNDAIDALREALGG